MIRFVDLFAGIGGVRLGFEQAMQEMGIRTQCVLSSEIDKYAQETYSMNFGEKPQGDIYQIRDIPDFDFLLAGFPCQPFSYAGKQKGFGDTRGTLFFEIERFLRDCQPQGFLLENVRGLTTHDEGRTFNTIIRHLKNLGYGVAYVVLNSSNFGVPQNRVRVYIVGINNKQPKLTLCSDPGAADSHKFKHQLLQRPIFESSPQKIVADILEDAPPDKYDCSASFVKNLLRELNGRAEDLAGYRMIDHRNGKSLHSWELGIKGECSQVEKDFMNALIANRRKKHFGAHQDGKMLSLEQIQTFFEHPDLGIIIGSLIKKGYLKELAGKYNPVSGNMSFEVFKFLDPQSVSITLVTSDAHKIGVVHKGRVRHITPRECARLQGFPDSFSHHPDDVHAYRQFGNSVSVPVVRAVILDLFRNAREPLIGNLCQPEQVQKIISPKECLPLPPLGGCAR